MPFSVSTGGGPVSGNVLSKWPARRCSSSTGAPLESSTGVQWTRSSEVAIWIAPSSQYIQYLPSIFAAISRFLPGSSLVTIPADLYLRCAYLAAAAPRNAGPRLVQCVRSVEVAIPTEYVLRFHCV